MTTSLTLYQSFYMQLLKKFFSVLVNRYFLVTVVFVVWMLFFDQRDFFQQRERVEELKKVEAVKKYYNDEIERTKKQVNNLQLNPTAIEKFARERYLLKRSGEEVYLFEDTTVKK